MFGPRILARTLSRPTREDAHGNHWQYHSRSDHHSKVACWGILFDLLLTCSLLRSHVESGKVAFGINHKMTDFQHNRKKVLDLVLCTPVAGVPKGRPPGTFAAMVDHYEIDLSSDERAALSTLPRFVGAPVGSVLAALEAKACMTAHQRALPRLYDELNSSHATTHGATDQAIAAGFVMVNVAPTFVSTDLNKWPLSQMPPRVSDHVQPRAAELVVAKMTQIPRRSKVGDAGFDAFAITAVDCRNDGTPVRLIEGPPGPAADDIYSYDSMIARLAHIYATRFAHL